jgi:hypothetical protein
LKGWYNFLLGQYAIRRRKRRKRKKEKSKLMPNQTEPPHMCNLERKRRPR